MKTKFTLLTLFVASGLTQAATFNVTNIAASPGDSRIIVNSSNNTLSSGYAALGYFSSFTAANFGTSTGADLANDFNILGSSANTFSVDFSNSGFFIDGGVQFTSTAPTTANPGGVNPDFINKIAYVIIANAADLMNATEAFIYNTGQNIPADPSNPITVDMSVDNLPGTIEFGSGDGVANVFLGATDLGQINNALKTAVLVPEPSTLLLSAFGVLGLLRRRR